MFNEFNVNKGTKGPKVPLRAANRAVWSLYKRFPGKDALVAFFTDIDVLFVIATAVGFILYFLSLWRSP